MSLNFTTPVINPRLGSSFSIFASTYLCVVLVLVILEQLGLEVNRIDHIIVLTPAVFYVLIGLITRTSNLEDFYVSGQRVPAIYNAITICSMVFGCSMILGGIGAYFFAGIDALAIPLGCFLGLIFMALFFVPYMRKASAFTVPGYIFLRFGRTSLRGFSSLLMLVPCFMILFAEISLGSQMTSYFLPAPQSFGFDIFGKATMTTLVFGVVLLTIIFGGMRSTTWTQCAQFIVFLSILAPLFVVSVSRTNLPFPQLTYGSQLDIIQNQEEAKGLTATTSNKPLTEALPSSKPQELKLPATKAYSAFRPMDFTLLVLSLAVGVASFPALLPRLSTTPTIMASRRSLGWVGVIGAVVLLTLPAYAFFTKAIALEGLLGVQAANMPAWGKVLQQIGVVSLPTNQFDSLGGASASAVTFQRDMVALVLPLGGGLPRVFLGLVAASAIAAFCACSAGQLAAIANTVSDDLYNGLLYKSASPRKRLLVARFTMLACGTLIFFMSHKIDPLRWVISAFSLSGGTFFAVLFLSIWWRRLNSAGAFFGMLAGFCVTGLYLVAGNGSLLGIDKLTAAAVGVPVSFAAAIAASLLTAPPSELALEAVDEVRVPSGESLQSRMQRLAARGKLPNSM